MGHKESNQTKQNYQDLPFLPSYIYFITKSRMICKDYTEHVPQTVQILRVVIINWL